MNRILICFTCCLLIQYCSAQRVILTPSVDTIKNKDLYTSILIQNNISDQSFISQTVSRQHTQPFFCNIEHKVNKKLPVPVFFRLGSKDYVDALENK